MAVAIPEQPAPPFWRSADGRTVHRFGCHHIGPRHLPWEYATGMTPDEIAVAAIWYGLRLCRDCLPTPDEHGEDPWAEVTR